MTHTCSKQLLVFTLAALMLVGAVASGSASMGPFLIIMEGRAPYYEPFEAVVPPQTPIEWKNPTASPHSIQHDGCVTGSRCAFSSGAVPPNGSHVISGLPAGRYPYHCEIHPIMRGELFVGNGPTGDHRS